MKGRSSAKSNARSLTSASILKARALRFSLVIVFLLPINTHAVNILLQAGLHFGGDDLITATFTNGDTEKLKAGQLISLSAGLGINAAENLEARFMAGVKFDTINAENGDLDFYRYPVEALLMYKANEKVFIGGGLSYHLNPSISGDGVASNANIDFDNALGFAVELDYLLSNGGYFAFKLTSIDYEAFGQSFSGNSIGGLFGFRF